MSKIKLVDFKTIEKNWLKDEKVRKAYEDLEPEYQLAKSLVEFRIRKKLSQAELAAKADMKQPVISRIESMKSLPSVSTLKKISKALDEPLLIKFGY